MQARRTARVETDFRQTVQTETDGGSCRLTKPKVRYEALDFAKGALVLLMVIYHWLNYFVSTQGFFYIYIRFVSGAFVLISGFLITNLYLKRTDLSSKTIALRFVSRGLRLVILFTALNLLGSLVVGRNYNGNPVGVRNFLSNAAEIYGVGKGEVAAFDILIPIAYLLIMCGLVFPAIRAVPVGIHFLSLVAVSVAVALNNSAFSSPNMNWLALGLVGASLGTLSIATINRVTANLLRFVVMYLLYMISITFLGTPYLVQIFGAILSVMFLYSIGSHIWDKSALGKHFVLLGKYSLLGYIVQIAALQMLRKVAILFSFEPLRLVLSAVAAVFVTSGIVILVDKFRNSSKSADFLYRITFG